MKFYIIKICLLTLHLPMLLNLVVLAVFGLYGSEHWDELLSHRLSLIHI